MERSISNKALSEVQAALFNGRKIEAVKIYRKDTGASLKDAKDAVERLEAEWRASSPEKFKGLAKRGRGCGICLVILLVGIGLILLLVLTRVSYEQ